MNIIIGIFVVILMLTVYQVNGIDFKDCGATTGVVSSITVSDCPPTAQSCAFKSGNNETIDVKFKSEIDSNTASVKIWGIIAGVPIPFNLPSDACGHYNIKCPINKDNNYELTVTVPILSQYPKIKLDVRVALMDSNKSKIFCEQFPVQIQ
ncbi:NPC intracellular cholesterol transporter 2-like [Oppia nitens]|uniref:NPC intracellular cholesterol transporter 2-like n=1 Tax=Oppia nitens TaxID=1686743 RepID=UPI0023DC1D30|nr:NPC intracellular cholesterol transporter 2-like [Oppia nitens]